VSARTTSDAGLDDRDRDHGAPTCAAPSCWEPGQPIEIVDRDVSEEPVLCETHRKAYLGVST